MSVVAPPAPTTGVDSTAAPAERGRQRPGLGTALVCVAAAVLFLWPVLALFLGAFYDASPGRPANWGLGAFARAFGEPALPGVLRNTILFTAIVVPLAVLLGLALAVLSQLSNARLARVVTPVVVVAYATPPMFYAIGYALTGAGRAGVGNDLVRLLVDASPFNLTSWPGLVYVSVLRAGAFAYILFIGPVRALARSHDEAAQIGGAGLGTRIRTILAPILRPSISGVTVLLVISHVQLFDAVYILGGSARIDTLAVLSYRLLGQDGVPDFGAATAIGVLVLAVALVLSLAQQRAVRAGTSVTVTGKPEPRVRLDLGRWRRPVDVFLGIYVVLVLVIPLGSILLTSLLPFPGVYRPLSLKSYVETLTQPQTAASIATTLGLAVGGGLLAMVAAFLLGYLRVHSPHRRAAAFLTLAGMAPVVLSGTIGALGYIWAVVLIPPLRPLYGTFSLLLIALATSAVPTLLMLFTGAIAQVDPSLVAAARVSGAGRFRSTAGIALPLLAPTLVNGWYLAAVVIAGALDLPLVLGSAELRTVSSTVYESYANAIFGRTTALLVLLLVAFALTRLVVQLIFWGLRADLRPRLPILDRKGRR